MLGTGHNVVARLALGVAVVAAIMLATAGRALAAPQPGLYEGHLANGITVAVTVRGTGPQALVTRAAAICQATDDSFVHDSGAIIRGVGARGAYQYRIARDGSFGHRITYGDDDLVAGKLDGATGSVSISRNSYVVRGCDPAHDPEHASVGHGDAYPVPVSLVGPARSSPVDGVWTRQDADGPGTFRVWGGGAFVGDFDGSPYIGQSDEAQCQATPASLNDGAAIAADGSFTLPWTTTAGLSGYDPVTPTTGVLGATSGTWTYLLDSPYITDQWLSGCAPPAPTTDPVALTTATGVERPFAAPRVSTSVPTGGGTTASARCAGGEHRTVAGRFVLCSTTKPQVNGNHVTLSGRVTINGFLFAKVDKLDVSIRSGTLHSEGQAQFGVIVSGYDVTLGRVALDLSSGHLKGVSLPGLRSGLSLGGLKLAFARIGGTPPKVSIDLQSASLTISAGIEKQIAGAKLSFDGELGIAPDGITADLSSKGFSIPLTVAGRQLFAIKSLRFHYEQASDSWSVRGAADVALPGGFGADASAEGGVKHGRFDSLALQLDVTGGAGIPGPFGTFVSGGSFSIAGVAQGTGSATIGLGLDGGWPYEVKRAVGLSFQGTGSFDVAQLRLELGANATLTAAGTQLADGKATLTVDFDAPLFELDTSVDVLDIIHGSTVLRIDGAHFLSQGMLTVEFGPDSPPIKFISDHWPFGWFVDPPSHIGPVASAEAVLSDIGAGARAQVHVWKLSFGATVWEKWGGSLHADIGFGQTEPLTGLAPPAGSASGPGDDAVARAAARRGQTVRVARGQQALVISGAGSASGRLQLRDPRGRLVVDAGHVAGASAVVDHGRVLVGRRGDQGGLIVRHPRAGRWRVASLGPAPFTSVTATAVHGPAAGLGRVASVRPRHVVRTGQLLRVRVRVPRGDSVQLRGSAARGGHDAGVPLGTAHRANARVRVPADYSGRRLTLVAVTRRHGVPVGVTRSPRRLVVRHRRFGRPQRLRVRRGAHATIVRFTRVRGAARYVVTLRVRGQRYATVARRPPVRLPAPTRGAAATVTVRAVSAATARVGPVTRLRLRGHHPRRTHHHHRPRRA